GGGNRLGLPAITEEGLQPLPQGVSERAGQSGKLRSTMHGFRPIDLPMPHYEGDLRAPDGARFAIIASRWNPRIVDALVESARATFAGNGVAEDGVDVVRRPGAWELRMAARDIARGGRHAAIVALGCVVRGDTRHYEQVADGASDGLMRVALDTGVPVLNGVLAVERFEDAQARAGGSHGNKGEEAALVAIEMADLRRKLQECTQ